MMLEGFYYNPDEHRPTPKRYFNLGVLSCTIGGLIFSVAIILIIIGSSPHKPEAIWITGIVLLLFGGLLFFLGIGSVGVYLSKEDRRKKEQEKLAARQYAASLQVSSDIMLIQ
ncbi:uncharacterized protein LOC143228945 [Tachypleus tridentatus]|uniref:uncharacterized protein LOC143228945 n=1 Tax=Tachypleus tridentatus TaxID=6853 RepID=UPI003FD5B868